MCKYCENKQSINSEYVEIEIKQAILMLSYDAYSCDSSFYEEILINYCPCCGEKLNDIQQVLDD